MTALASSPIAGQVGFHGRPNHVTNRREPANASAATRLNARLIRFLRAPIEKAEKQKAQTEYKEKEPSGGDVVDS
jgi:hypothetical protein